jgi:hypothetical protein
MLLRSWSRRLIVIVCVLLATSSLSPSLAQPFPTAGTGVHLLSSAVVGRPLATERAIFWKEIQGPRLAIQGYDLVTAAPFLVAERSGDVFDLVADGAILAWAERDTATAQLRILGFDLRARSLFSIRSFAGRAAMTEIALDRGVLYYTDATPGHRGLFAHDLATAAERRISAAGSRPVARDGALLWSEARPSSVVGRAIWSLHLRTSDERHTDTTLAEREAGYAGFNGYESSGNIVVWAFAPSAGDPHIYLHDISAGTTTAIAATPAGSPRVRGGTIAWASANAAPRWRVYAYELGAGRVSTVVEDSSAAVAVWALAGPRQALLGVAAGPTRGTQTLYISDLHARGVRFAAPAAATFSASTCNPAAPISCGQVRTGGAALSDAGGTWHMQGVQFILPQFGINSKTFWTGNYSSARADGSLDYWLDKAQHYLRASALRIFVDLPHRRLDGSLVVPTDYATLFDFAARANARGMRVAITLHNSADWAMTGDRAGWIGGLLDFFSARGGLAMIAYLSADNEINNHCAHDGRDCFDSDQQYDARAYVDGAVEWVARFRDAVKSRAPQLLVTVGISTEMYDVDQTRGAFNFFRADSRGRTLAGLVDFVAPHNFGGGAAGIIDDIRYANYTGPVVLEEYGYPTDPYPRGAYWTEGAPACRIDPALAVCTLTAPFFVETNIQAQRTRDYAGGSAWMIADMREKNSSSACSDPRKPFDLWTGLFAIGGTYCAGGTYSRAQGQPKATAVRVCAYYSDDLSLCEPGVPPPRRVYLPIVTQR